jgi:hypothetical protein
MLGGAGAEEIKRWGRAFPDAQNTGILTRLAPSLDVDILDHEAAEAVERLIRDDMCIEERGTMLVRFGQRPRRAILFRTNEPSFKKISRTLLARNGGEQKLEMLADGRQLIVAGIHPDTGKPYTWLGDVCPGAIVYDELPYLHAYEARDLIDAAAALLIKDFGFTDKPPKKIEPVAPRPSPHPGDSQPYAQTALERECAVLANTGSGGRNDALNKASLKLFELVAAGALPDDQVEAELIRACEANGLIADDGILSVRATIRSGARKGLTQPRAIPQRQTHHHEEFDRSIPDQGILNARNNGEATSVVPLGEWDAGDDIEPPPPRAWLLGNVFARTFLSELIAESGTGKTAVRYAQYLSLSTDRELTGEHVFQRVRVLIVSLEDDDKELRRRILAVRLHYGINAADVRGWLFLSAPRACVGKLLGLDAKGRPVRGTLAATLEAVVVARKIDLVALDPFIKTHSVPENDNTLIDEVAQVLTDLATKYDIAVDIPHHVSKGAADPGNANRGRGASAAKDAPNATARAALVLGSVESFRFVRTHRGEAVG